MPVPVIDALPPAPLPTDTPPSVFVTKAAAQVAAQAVMVGQINTATAFVNERATAAEGAAGAAAGSATVAGGYAASALGHANTAGGHAATAGAQAGIATTKAEDAAATLVSILALLDQFDDRYLGVKATDPVVDNDGNALQAGAIYVNSNSGFLRAYTGTVWVQGISALAGVESINGLMGAITLKTINGQALVGAGDISAQTPHYLLMAQGVI